MRGLLEDGLARGELRPGTPVEALAGALVDLLYGQMLCWDMSGGAYGLEARIREFCDRFLQSLINPYLKEKDA